MEREAPIEAGAAGSEIQANRELIHSARSRGRRAVLGAFVKLSGPGWLQSAITLGGGSLASSLYLGIFGGMAVLWLQPLAMILGVVMLSAIGYVALSTGQRPFRAINTHVNPVLGWGWLLATMMANLVWALPQFSLATASMRQNLLPGLLGPDVMADMPAKLIICVAIAVVCILMVWFYDSGKAGVKLFNTILKIMVAVIVLAFFGVVVRLGLAPGGLDWGSIFSGLIPDVSLLTAPGKTFAPHIEAVGEAFRSFWTHTIVSQRRDVMIAAAATAVGINMTFLLPYSMLRRGWDKDFRGLAIFDLGTGLFIPFILATGCVVIASSARFHATPAPGLLAREGAEAAAVKPNPKLLAKYEGLAAERVKHEIGDEAFAKLSEEQVADRIAALPAADKKMAAMLVRRDAFDLAESLSPLTGDIIAHYVFGIGVVGMATSTIIILMVINGFVVCEVFNVPSRGWPYRLGALMPCVGILGPFIWTGGKAQFWLAVPTSNIAFVLLPIAYISFVFLMNRKGLLGDSMPRGGKRLVWNALMIAATGLFTVCSVWRLWSGLRWKGIALMVTFIVLCAIAYSVRRARRPKQSNEVRG